jgi:hypothetical protein
MTKSSNTSPRKAAANRRNAWKSTGPRTAGGKSWSRLNALKHGILASQTVIATIEGRAERKLFEATVAGLAQDFQPEGAYEQLLVQEIAACFWRKRRLLMFENHAAFDVIERSASHEINYPLEKPIPWRDRLYTDGDKLTTAEQIYNDAGLDGITLPNEADTLRVIRYEAAINRTRERAVRSLREMRAARRGAARPRAEVAPAIDRAAARRNAHGAPAKMLSPCLSVRVWDKLAKVYREAEEEQAEGLRGELRGGEAETDQTKPKKVITPDIIEDMRKSLYRGLYGREMPEESEDEPATPPDDPNKPPAE